MGSPNPERDVALVKECLSGSEQAWNELYCRYVALVKSVVRRKMGTSHTDVEDITQNVFVSLISSLSSYDPAYSLSRFICMVAERLCIREYRQSKAIKRDAEIEPLDLHDSRQEGTRKAASELVSQEVQLERSQLTEILRRGLKGLDSGCRELLTLRYYEELPFKEIARNHGASENTVTVQTRRCLEELRVAYERQARRASPSSMKRAV